MADTWPRDRRYMADQWPIIRRYLADNSPRPASVSSSCVGMKCTLVATGKSDKSKFEN
jgi:hypothetical protein